MRKLQKRMVAFGPLVARPSLEALHRAVPVVREDVAAETWDLDLVAGRFGFHIGPAEQDERLAGARLPVSFHGGDLGRLVLQRIEAVQVSGHHLDRRDDGGHPHGHGEHHARAFVGAVAQKVEGADRADDKGGRQVGGEHHVHEAVGERRVENDGPPVGGMN